MEYLEMATSQLNIWSLRNIALLAFHSLLAPQQGNCNQLIGMAVRLCRDLKTAAADESSLRNLSLSVLCMALQVSLTMDRPGLLDPSDAHLVSGGNNVQRGAEVGLLYALLSIQSKLRQQEQDEAVRQQLRKEMRTVTDRIMSQERPSPNLISVLRETELSLGQDSAAEALLRVYDGPNCFHTFLTPHWIFKAARTMLDRPVDVGATRSTLEFQTALLMLDRDALKWPSSQVLLDHLLRG
jgi:hypothetical protein